MLSTDMSSTESTENINIDINIDPDSIKQLLLWVWENEREKCGRLFLFRDMYYIEDNKDNVSDGKTETYGDGQIREGCIFPHPRGHMFFHTHPIGSKSYPSYEDIISVAKLSYDKSAKPISMIGTRWGIWFIRKRKSHHALDKEYSLYFHDDYVKAVKVLYKQALYDIDEGDMETHIHTFCRHMNKVLKELCQITFVRWPSINRLIGKRKSTKKTRKSKIIKIIKKSKKKSIKRRKKSYNKARKRNA
jgi:hypothetical protein